MKIKMFCAFVAFAFLLSSCDKAEDKNIPKIFSFDLNGSNVDLSSSITTIPAFPDITYVKANGSVGEFSIILSDYMEGTFKINHQNAKNFDAYFYPGSSCPDCEEIIDFNYAMHEMTIDLKKFDRFGGELSGEFCAKLVASTINGLVDTLYITNGKFSTEIDPIDDYKQF